MTTGSERVLSGIRCSPGTYRETKECIMYVFVHVCEKKVIRGKLTSLCWRTFTQHTPLLKLLRIVYGAVVHVFMASD